MYTRFNTQLTLAAIAVAATFSSTATANTSDTDSIVVTATRFADSERAIASNVTVIRRSDIDASPALSLPELLSSAPGVEVRPLYGNQGADTKIDIRGFGDNGHLRTLVMVDGRRIEQLDFSSPVWSSIPLDSIERIEVIAGSSTVLYGDQAVGGVINIVTRSPHKDSASASLVAGSFDFREAKGSISRKNLGESGVGVVADVTSSTGNEYRDNNKHRSQAFNSRFSLLHGAEEYFVDIGTAKTRFGLPGALTQQQFDLTPRSAETSDSYFERTNWRVRPGLAAQPTADIDLRLELSHEQSNSESWISNWASFLKIDTGNTAITPRIRWRHGLGNMKSTTTAGFDIGQVRLDQTKATAPGNPVTSSVELRRDSAAFYAHNVTQLTPALALQAGARQQRIDESISRTGTASQDNRSTQRAWEIGSTWHAVERLKLFARTSTTFRFPVLDEYTTFTGIASPLPKPETGRGIDAGAEYRRDQWRIKATAYELKMENEIAYNNATFQNENLQKTVHRGIEVTGSAKPVGALTLDASFATKSATFQDGPNAGKTIPLVARKTASVAGSYDASGMGKHTLTAQYLGKRYFGGDDVNSAPQLPSVTTFDWQSSLRTGAWTLALKVNNLTDRKYAVSGFDFGFGASYYIANPRTAYISGKYDF